jgi:hypothetical protein
MRPRPARAPFLAPPRLTDVTRPDQLVRFVPKDDIQFDDDPVVLAIAPTAPAYSSPSAPVDQPVAFGTPYFLFRETTALFSEATPET